MSHYPETARYMIRSPGSGAARNNGATAEREAAVAEEAGGNNLLAGEVPPARRPRAHSSESLLERSVLWFTGARSRRASHGDAVMDRQRAQ